jgi:hypothetical protein
MATKAVVIGAIKTLPTLERFCMKKRIYIETTVVSYYVARPSRDLLIAGHREATHELWPKLFDEYEPFISALVFEEARKGDQEQSKKRLANLRNLLSTREEFPNNTQRVPFILPLLQLTALTCS